MKAVIPLKHTTIEVEGENQKDLFQKIAQATEVFGEKSCGLCKSENIRPVLRNVTSGKKTYDYFEWQCQNPKCRAKLALGQSLVGNALFPIRKLTEEGKPDRESGKYGEHNGWTKYRGEQKED